MSDYTVKNGIIYSENGLPWMPRLFCDDRLMFEIDDNSVTEVRYFSPDSFGSSIILKKNFVSSINFYLETPDTNHGLLPKKTRLLPCGFDAEWKVRDIITEFSVYALKNSIVITLKTPENIPEGYNFKCEFSEKGFFMPLSSVPSEFCNPQLGGPERKWGKFRFEDNNFFNSFIEKEGDKECSIAFNVGFDFEMSFRETANNKKFAMKSEDLLPSRNYHMVISFDESNEAARNKCDFIIQNAQNLIDEQRAR